MKRLRSLYLTCVLLAAACGDRSGPSPSPAGDGPFAVGTLETTFVDTTRPTAANGDEPAKDSRTLTTRIYYPAVGAPEARELPGAAPATDQGPFPLVAFAHGFQAVSEVYRDLYLAWARAGYVVAAPDFPLSSSRSTRRPLALDYVNQPADLSFLIDRLLEEGARARGALAGLIDGERIGVAGQSLGGMTTMGVAFNTCCADPRLDAAIPMAGRLAPFPDGAYFGGIEGPPILVIHGDQDETVPYEDGRAIYDGASAPRFLLTIVGGDHIVPYVAGPGNPLARPVLDAAVAFFDFYLKGRPDGLDRLRALGALDVAEVEGVEDR